MHHISVFPFCHSITDYLSEFLWLFMSVSISVYVSLFICISSYLVYIYCNVFIPILPINNIKYTLIFSLYSYFCRDYIHSSWDLIAKFFNQVLLTSGYNLCKTQSRDKINAHSILFIAINVISLDIEKTVISLDNHKDCCIKKSPSRNTWVMHFFFLFEKHLLLLFIYLHPSIIYINMCV